MEASQKVIDAIMAGSNFLPIADADGYECHFKGHHIKISGLELLELTNTDELFVLIAKKLYESVENDLKPEPSLIKV